MRTDPELKKFEKSETWILSVLIFFFFGIAAVSYFLKLPNIFVAVCLTTSIVALIYRFLGGIEGASIKWKGINLVGAAAVIASGTWGVNYYLDRQRPAVIPSPESWIAIDESGQLIPVTIGENIYPPDTTHFLTRASWYVTDDGSEELWITNGTYKLAKLDPESLEEIGFFNWIEMGEEIRYTDRMTAGTEANLWPPLSLKIRATAFRDEFNSFEVLDQNDTIISQGTLRTRHFEIIEHGGNHYIIMVRGAVHNDPKNEPWASFAVMQVDPVTR